MSLTKDRNDIVFQCDGKGCHATLETCKSNFDGAQNVLHRHRWKLRKTKSGEWEHFCPECQQETLL